MFIGWSIDWNQIWSDFWLDDSIVFWSMNVIVRLPYCFNIGWVVVVVLYFKKYFFAVSFIHSWIDRDLELDFFHMLNGFLYLFFKSIWIWNFYFNIKESPSAYRRGRDEFDTTGFIAGQGGDSEPNRVGGTSVSVQLNYMNPIF